MVVSYSHSSLKTLPKGGDYSHIKDSGLRGLYTVDFSVTYGVQESKPTNFYPYKYLVGLSTKKYLY